MDVTPIGETYAVTFAVVDLNDATVLDFVINLFNGINAMIFPF
jgi:hypothetical protein